MSTAAPLPPGLRFIERDWLSSNGILFDDGRRTALVDSGYVKHQETTAAVVSHALGGRPLDLLVNTHLHSDHCGGNALLQHRHGCRTLVPAASAAAARDWNDEALTFTATGQRCERFAVHGTYDDGDTLELGGLQWQAISAPGHDPQALILHCASERLLISADALWENGFGVIFPELDGESGFAEQRAILERIATLPVERVLPGHGPMFTDVAGALERARARLAHLSADPARNARHAVKVLLKFLLLEHERLPLAGVARLLADTPLTARANRRYLGTDPQALADWAVAELCRVGAAAVYDGLLLNG